MTFQHRAGVSPYTSSFDLAETCVFAKQSLGPFLCNLSVSFYNNRIRLPFSRSYGVILPSSLTTLLPLILGFSPHLPVSVCGTGTFSLNRSFSRQCEISCFPTLFSVPFMPHASRIPDLPRIHTRHLARLFHSTGQLILLCHSISQTVKGGTGISTSCPSPTPFGLGLGPDLP